MSTRPDFLKQTAKLKQQDRELQDRLKAEAEQSGVVLSKDSRRLDFVERSIAEVETALRGRKIDTSCRAALKGRLTFLREERTRLLS